MVVVGEGGSTFRELLFKNKIPADTFLFSFLLHSLAHVRAGFPVEVGRAGAHFNTFCIKLQLKILFILDETADSSLHHDCLVCQDFENSEKCRHTEPEP